VAKKSYVEIQERISKLQAQAEKAKAEEAKGVIEKVKEAIAFYGLKPADLFGSTRRAIKRARPAKYTDGNGNTWHGIGKRPNWLKAMLAKGKSLDQLRV
jgi:DNA-binding protein H-NS